MNPGIRPFSFFSRGIHAGRAAVAARHGAGLRRGVSLVLVLGISLLLSAGAWGQSRMPADPDNWLQVTGQTGLGSRSLVNVAFFEVPDSVSGTLYFAVRNPNTSNTVPDQGAGDTTFRLYGESGALSNPNARLRDYPDGDQALPRTGTLLGSFTYASGGAPVGWIYFPGVDVTQGEKIGNRYYFKVIAEAQAGTNQKNAYQLDVSVSGSGNPTGAGGVRSFAYSWTVNLSRSGDTPTPREWNLYPFVPEGTDGDFIVFSNWDFDEDSGQLTTIGTWFNPAADRDGAIGPSNNNEFRNTSVGVLAAEVNATWRTQYLSTNTAGGGVLAVLTAQIWHSYAATAPGDIVDYPGDDTNLFRSYAAPFFPAAPDAVALSLQDGTAISDGIDEEIVTLQIVDAAGTPVPYVRSVWVDVTGSAAINGGAPGAGALITTTSDGIANFVLTNEVAETVTITLTTDGLTGGSSVLTGPNDSGEVVFVERQPPSLSSAANTTLDIATDPAGPIADVVVTENETGNITADNNIRIRLPAELSDTYFNTAAAVTATVAGAGTGAVNAAAITYEGGVGTENVLVLPVTGNFEAGQSVTISGIRLATGTVTASGRLRLSFDGGANYLVGDDKVVSVQDLSIYTWLGAAGTSWDDPANWNQGAVPGPGGAVIIPATSPLPVLDVNTAVLRSLIIDAGAGLTTNGFVLNINGPMTVNGSIIGTATYAAATLSGTLTSGGGNIVFSDAITLGGDLIVRAGGGTVTFQPVATVNGVHRLTLETSGAIELGSIIGGMTQPTRLTVDGGGTTTLSAASYRIVGSTTVFNNPVVINADTTYSDSTSITFNNTVNILAGRTLTLETPDLTFNNPVSGDGSLSIRPYTVGGSIDITGAPNIGNLGGLTLGSSAGDTMNVLGSALIYTVAPTTLSGTVTTANAVFQFAGVTLGASVSLDSGGGNISIATLTGNDRNLTIAAGTGVGTTTVSGTVTNLGTGTGAALIVANGVTGLVSFQDTFGGNSGIQASGGAQSLRFAGDVTLGDGNTGSSIATTQLDGASFSGFDGINLGALTLSTGAATITSNGSAIDLTTITGGGQNLTLVSRAGPMTASGAATGLGTVTLHDNDPGSTGAVVFQGSLVAATLTTVGRPYAVSLLGATTEITNAVTFANTGTLTLGDEGTDSLTFTDGVVATAPGAKSVAGTISAAGVGAINLGTTGTTVTADATVGGTSTGQITLAGVTLQDGVTLTLGGGAATPVTTAAITGTDGGAASDLVINTANTVTVGGVIGTDIGNLTLSAGTLAMGANGLTVGGNISQGGGGITSTVTVTLNGAGPQSVDLSTSTLATLSVASTGGVTTAAGFTVGTFTKTNTGTFSLSDGHTLTVNTGFTASEGTVTLTGTYAGVGVPFTVNGGTVAVGINAFGAGAMAASAGSFTQTGDNTANAQQVDSLEVSGTGSVVWDSASAGGSLAISGALTLTAGTLDFNWKNVSIGTSVDGAITFYDLTIPSGVTLTPAATTLTVLRNLTLENTGLYVTTNNPTLLLGTTAGVAGNITDNNATPVNLGTVIVDTQTKTLQAEVAVSSLEIREGGAVATNNQDLTVSGAVTTSAGGGTLAATNAETITVGGNFTVGTFTAVNSTVILDGATAASIAGGYTFHNLTVNKDATGNTVTPGGPVTVANTLTLTRGEWVAGGNTLVLTSGNWDSSAAEFTFSQGTSTVQLNAAAPTVTQKTGELFYNLVFQAGGTLGSAVGVENNFTAANAGGGGTLTLGVHTLTVAGNVDLAPGVTGATLAVNTSTLVLNGTGDQSVISNGQSWHNLTIADRTAGTVTFADAFTVGGTWTVTGPGAYNVTLSAGGTATNHVTFANTGALTISNGFTFTGGVTATAPSANSLAGTITTANSAVNLGTRPVVLTANTSVNTDIGVGDVTLGGTVNGAFNLAVAAGTGSVSFPGTVGSVTPLGAVTIVSSSATRFGGDVTTVGVQTVTSGVIRTNGVHTTSDSDATFSGPLELQSNTSIVTGAGGGNVSLDGIIDASTAGVQSLTVAAGTGAVVITDSVGANTRLSGVAVSGGGVTLHGIGTAVSVGATTVTLLAQQEITLDGQNYRSSGTQSFTAGAAGVRFIATGGWDAGAGEILLPGTDVYLDSPGTVDLESPLSADTFVFYRGVLNAAGQSISIAGDLVGFGASYDPNDPDRNVTALANTFFAYPNMASLAYYSGGGTFNAGETFGVAPTASFGLVRPANITVGGNFYANGLDLDGTAEWTLSIPDNSGADLLAAPPFGAPFAVLFNASVSYGTVSGGTVSAAALAPGPEHNNGVVNGGNNTGWVFTRPHIMSVYTINDRIVRVEFSEPLANRNDEIRTVVEAGGVLFTNAAAIATPGGGTGTRVFANAYREPTGHVLGDPLDESTLEPTTGLDSVTIVYLKLAESEAGLRWKTDATGSGAPGAINGGQGDPESSDRAGNKALDNVPDVFFVKGTLYGDAGRTLARNYGYNGFDRFDQAVDRAGPVLYRVEYGRAGHNEPAVTSYDAHNYFHLFYSEAVNIGANPEFAGSTPTAQNVRSETSFTAGGHGGDIRSTGGAGSDVLVDGYFRYDDPLGVGPIERGARTGPVSANALYRRDTEGVPSPFVSEPHELRIYLSGFNDGAVPADTLFPGWHANVPDPADATSVVVLENDTVRDATGNQLDHRVQLPIAAFVADSAGVAPEDALTGQWINAWDVERPAFGLHSELEYSIVILVDPSTGFANRFEFFIHDDETLEDNWIDPAPEIQRLFDVFPVEFRHAPAYDYSPHPGSANNRIRGVRGSTLNYPGDGIDEYLAFGLEQFGVESMRTDRNLALETGVENPLYGLIVDEDDSYFRLRIQASGHPWGLITDMWVSYDHTQAYITDLAGNLLPSTSFMRAIKQTPPRMNLALAAVGGNRVYVKFTEPVFGDEDATTPIDETVLRLQPPGAAAPIQFVGITTVDGSALDPTGGDREFFFLLPQNVTVTAAYALEGFLVPTADVVFDQVGNSIFADDVHRVTDIGIGVVEPVWASDGIRDDALGGVAGALRVFDGSGFLGKRDITLQARITADNAVSWPLLVQYDIDPPPSVFATPLGYWVPSIVPGLTFFKQDNRLDEPETYNAAARAVAPSLTQGRLRTFDIPASDLSAATEGSSFEFHFRLGNIFTARLLDDADPTTIVPWSFSVGGAIEQRGGVTIFNNVINPLENERAVLTVKLPEAGLVTVQVMTLDGSLVRMIQRGRLGIGDHTFTWDGRNMANREVARGMYFVRVVGPGIDEYRKVLVVK